MARRKDPPPPPPRPAPAPGRYWIAPEANPSDRQLAETIRLRRNRFTTSAAAHAAIVRLRESGIPTAQIPWIIGKD